MDNFGATLGVVKIQQHFGKKEVDKWAGRVHNNTMMNTTKEGKMFKLAYCDKIAFEIRKALAPRDVDGIIAEVGSIKFDLDENGAFRSPAKSITVYDVNGKAYIVTVQEAPMLDRDI